MTLRIYVRGGLHKCHNCHIENKKYTLDNFCATKSLLLKKLESLSPENIDPIELQSHGKGKFGRILGEFFINGKNINQLMVDNGHAVEYFGGKR